MEMTRATLIAVALSCFVVGGADGNELFEDCQKGRGGNFSDGACAGYIVGAHDAYEGVGGFCVPAEANAGQIIDVVKIYLRDHPEKRHLSGSRLILQALKEKVPCN